MVQTSALSFHDPDLVWDQLNERPPGVVQVCSFLNIILRALVLLMDTFLSSAYQNAITHTRVTPGIS